MSPAHVSAGIVTDDADELLTFYADGLGFQLESTSEFPQGTVHRLRRDDAHCKLYAPVDGAARPPRPDPWFRDVGFAYAALHVDDVEATAAAAQRAGAAVLTAPTSHRPGAVYALIADPQGNVWELLQEA
ncbi:VOC family protein [Actinospongicola halichondriae]|uniref:VOC family protein n=1 Tax=Actinospongicola halichondriae TaxID=3236844 RepID=UPI003D455848